MQLASNQGISSSDETGYLIWANTYAPGMQRKIR